MGPFHVDVKHRVADPFRRLGVRGVRYVVTPQLASGSPAEILVALGTNIEAETDAEEHLLRLVEERAAQIVDIPDVAPVVPLAEPGDSECPDLLTAVTIIAKSSEKVFIKSKRPLLSRLRKYRSVVLLIPEPKEN